MPDISKAPAMKGRIQELTDEDLNGLELSDLNCRGCSGYGNCGFKSYRLYKGAPVSICVQRLEKLQSERQASQA